MPKTVAELSLSLHDLHGFQTSHEPCRSRLRAARASSAMAARHQAARRRRAYRFQVRYVLKNRRRLGMALEPSSWVVLGRTLVTLLVVLFPARIAAEKAADAREMRDGNAHGA